MSAEIATFYTSTPEIDAELRLTAYVGGPAKGRKTNRCVQISIGQEWFGMTESQVRALISILQLRVNGNLSATAADTDWGVDPKGIIYDRKP